MPTDFDSTRMVFRNRMAAGRVLAKQLAVYRDRADVVVVGLPRGGVVVAGEVARALGLRLEVLTNSHRPLPLHGCTAIVVDDGLVTGATMRKALALLRAERPAWIIVAVPVGPPDAQDLIGTAVDEFVCTACPPEFRRIGDHYAQFAAVGDAELLAAIAASRRGN